MLHNPETQATLVIIYRTKTNTTTINTHTHTKVIHDLSRGLLLD